MSIFKTFIIDSNNKSRGDDGIFEIDIDKNYFNKTPSAIRLIDSNIPVEAELMNESNNVMRVERLDDKGKILSFIDIKFPPVANINSENDFINDVLRPNIRNQIDGSLIFDSKGYFDIQYVTNDGLVVPYPTFINKQVSNFSFGYYALIEINITENYAINFAVDNSIGPLLGYGARRFTKMIRVFIICQLLIKITISQHGMKIMVSLNRRTKPSQSI